MILNIIMMKAYPGFFGTQSHLRGLQLGSRGGRRTIPCTKLTTVKTAVTFWKGCGTEHCIPEASPYMLLSVLYSTQKKESGNEAIVLTPAAQSPPPSVPCWHLTSGVQCPCTMRELQATSASNPLSNGTPISLVWKIHSSKASYIVYDLNWDPCICRPA